MCPTLLLDNIFDIIIMNGVKKLVGHLGKVPDRSYIPRDANLRRKGWSGVGWWVGLGGGLGRPEIQ
jgi:hypothetical protein